MAKYLLEFKMKAIQLCLDGNSNDCAVTTFSVDDFQVRRWRVAYQHYGIEGITPRKTEAYYPVEFRINILLHMRSNGLCQRDSCFL